MSSISWGLENFGDLGIHLLPIISIVPSWRRMRKLKSDEVQIDRPSTALFWVLITSYAVLLLLDVFSLNSAALHQKFLFSAPGLTIIYVNIVIGATSAIMFAFRTSPLRWLLVTTGIVVALVSVLDLVRAVDVGI